MKIICIRHANCILYTKGNTKMLLILGASKMELRTFTISYARGKSKVKKNRELLVKDRIDELHTRICSSDELKHIDQDLKQYDALTCKKELQQNYRTFKPTVCGFSPDDCLRQELYSTFSLLAHVYKRAPTSC